MENAQDKYLRFGPYLELMAGLRAALAVNEGIIKLVGQEGSGKTAICRQLAAELKALGTEVIFFETPPESPEFLHQRIQSELGLDPEKNFNRALTAYLQAKAPPHNRLVIIYDDAEKITKDIFILIRLLNNIHGHSDTLVSQIICGTRRLDTIFDDPDLRSLTQYLNQSFTLAAMDRDALEDFHAGYRKLKNISRQTLSNKTLTDIFITGKGMPGKTLELFDQYYKPFLDHAGDDERAAATHDVQPTSTPDAVAAKPDYAKEVNAILDADEDYRASRFPVYFKAVLSLAIIVVTIVLAFVLSLESEVAPSLPLALLDDDAPLYLDEVELEQDVVEVLADDGAAPDVAQESVQAVADNDAMPVAVATSDISVIASAGESVTGEIAVTDPGPQEVTVAVAEEPVPDAALAAVTDAPGAAEPETVVADTDPADLARVAPLSSTTGIQESRPVDSSLANDLQAIVTRWSDAWQSGNFAGYLAAYSDGFLADEEGARADWEAQRRSRIDNVDGISISFDRYELTTSEGPSATVRFWLYYSRGNYADETLKEIGFQQEAGGWRITSERNLEINVL